MKNRLLVLGDVHGGYKALVQALDRANFDRASDRLIFLGDVCDGWPETARSIQYLSAIGAESIWGNHDQWTWHWMASGVITDIWSHHNWISQGGQATYDSFKGDPDYAKSVAAPYFNNLKNYIYDEERDYVFVHGGIPFSWNSLWKEKSKIEALDFLDRDYLAWDRELFYGTIGTYKGDSAYTGPVEKYGGLTPFKKTFIGHTTTTRHSDKPIEAGGVVLMDTGAGWEGKLSLMDVDSGEVWQSDKVENLYPQAVGRR